MRNIVIVLLTFFCIPVLAQEEEEGTSKHRVAVYYGNQFIPDAYQRPTADFTSIGQLGLDYEYRISTLFGIGLNGGMEMNAYQLLDEGVKERENAINTAILARFHFGDGFGFLLGPGMELAEESQLLLRAGFEYRFLPGKGWDITPTMWYDYKESHHSILLGLALGYSL